jgi:hypothetical protein
MLFEVPVESPSLLEVPGLPDPDEVPGLLEVSSTPFLL